MKKMTFDEMIRSGALEEELQKLADAEDNEMAQDLIRKVAKRRKELQKSGRTADINDFLGFVDMHASQIGGGVSAEDDDTPDLSKVRVRKMSKATALAVSLGDTAVTELPLIAEANTAEDLASAEIEIQTRLARALSQQDHPKMKEYASALVKVRMCKSRRYIKADDKSVIATVEAIASADLPCYVDRTQLITRFLAAALPGQPASLSNSGLLQPDSPSGSDQWDKITREILGDHFPTVFPGSDNAGTITPLNLNLTGEKAVLTGYEKRDANREGITQTQLDEEQRKQRLEFARSTSIPTKEIFGVN